ncbi:MAG: hypothetical protein V8S87_08185 [Oscillospiraceae bacterium]
MPFCLQLVNKAAYELPRRAAGDNGAAALAPRARQSRANAASNSTRIMRSMPTPFSSCGILLIVVLVRRNGKPRLEIELIRQIHDARTRFFCVFAASPI